MNNELLNALESIPVADLDRSEWIAVGMALKLEGADCSVWDEWSKDDSRYHPGECAKQWASFKGSLNPVTGATIFELAKRHGWRIGGSSEALDWDSVIFDDTMPMDYQSFTFQNEPNEWKPTEQLITYLETLFDESDIVGYVSDEACLKEGKDNSKKWVPSGKGVYDRTAGELIASLRKHPDEIEYTIGDYHKEAGAWIRFNSLDGEDVKNANVTNFRYALVECDEISLEEQDAFYRKMELPIACLVYSGGKSLHAIVKVDAPDFQEYRKRVNFLYDFLLKNGCQIDKQNNNPSRLSRMPGVERGGEKQFIVATNIGRKNWIDWVDFAEGIDDPLPQFENLADLIKDPPVLKDAIIEGVLRRGHKMMIAAAPKAGKSILLSELALACASGGQWLGYEVKQGKVLYVNLEIDYASFFDRLRNQIARMTVVDDKAWRNLNIWNLRGQGVPLDEMVTKIIRRTKDDNYSMIIIDPIYKIINGDENNATDMSKFTSAFDKLAEGTGASVVYAHHHSKGSQGQKKAIDRSSGSGVFARDADALLDMSELDVPDAIKNKHFNAFTRGFRLEFTLREFADPKPFDVMFDYPIHTVDEQKILKDCYITGSPEANNPKYKTDEETRDELIEAYQCLKSFKGAQEPVSVEELADYIGVVKKTITNRIKGPCHDVFRIYKGLIFENLQE